MKPFRFSLQSIRVLREQKEREAQQRFADAMRACEEAAFQLQESSDALAAGWGALCEELSEGVAATSCSAPGPGAMCLNIDRRKRRGAAKRAPRHGRRLARDDAGDARPGGVGPLP